MSTSAAYQIYTSITRLPLNLFVTCMCEGRYDVLIIEGKPSEDALAAAWLDIRQQYADAIGDNEYKLYLSIFKEINRLSAMSRMVDMLISNLEKYYVEEFEREINQIFHSNYSFKTPEESAKSIALCVSKKKAFDRELKIKLIHFQQIQKKQEAKEGVAPTREYFQSVMITLSDHVKYQLPDTITVYEYCDRIKRLNKHIDQLKNQRQPWPIKER